jgi:hypothetical protein
MKKLILITLFSIGMLTVNAQNYTPCNPANECNGDNKKVTNEVYNFTNSSGCQSRVFVVVILRDQL